jgi:hypothetical protein
VEVEALLKMVQEVLEEVLLEMQERQDQLGLREQTLVMVVITQEVVEVQDSLSTQAHLEQEVQVL